MLACAYTSLYVRGDGHASLVRFSYFTASTACLFVSGINLYICAYQRYKYTGPSIARLYTFAFHMHSYISTYIPSCIQWVVHASGPEPFPTSSSEPRPKPRPKLRLRHRLRHRRISYHHRHRHRRSRDVPVSLWMTMMILKRNHRRRASPSHSHRHNHSRSSHSSHRTCWLILFSINDCMHACKAIYVTSHTLPACVGAFSYARSKDQYISVNLRPCMYAYIHACVELNIVYSPPI